MAVSKFWDNYESISCPVIRVFSAMRVFIDACAMRFRSVLAPGLEREQSDG